MNITAEKVKATQGMEKKSVLGVEPTPGSTLGRPELERRPETGSTSFFNIMSFDGPGPETMNGRLVRGNSELVVLTKSGLCSAPSIMTTYSHQIVCRINEIYSGPITDSVIFTFLQAMLGCVWAVVAELMTGLRVVDQVNTPGSSGLFWLLTATQITIWASLIPLFNGESPDSRR